MQEVATLRHLMRLSVQSDKSCHIRVSSVTTDNTNTNSEQTGKLHLRKLKKPTGPVVNKSYFYHVVIAACETWGSAPTNDPSVYDM